MPVKSYSIDDHFHYIETDLVKVRFQMWEGKIEWADDPYYSFMKGWTIKKAEEWFKQKPSTRPVQALIKHHEDWHKEHLKRIARYDGTRYGRNGEIID